MPWQDIKCIFVKLLESRNNYMGSMDHNRTLRHKLIHGWQQKAPVNFDCSFKRVGEHWQNSSLSKVRNEITWTASMGEICPGMDVWCSFSPEDSMKVKWKGCGWPWPQVFLNCVSQSPCVLSESSRVPVEGKPEEKCVYLCLQIRKHRLAAEQQSVGRPAWRLL